MISELKVQNFAIIDNLNVEFKKGFTALTGETGAGKSLIIDAIGLLLGNRSQTSMIRNGETKAIVEGVFEKVSDYTKQVLDDLQIELLDGDVVVIKRELSQSGKNLIRVNGEIITLNQLELLASTLGDIHTQNETHKLFNPHNYLTFINNETISSLLDEYKNLRSKYLEALNVYNEIINLSKTDATNLEYWEFQYKELEKASLSVNEETALEEELSFLNNYENIFKYLTQINDDFKENNILENLYDTIFNVQKLGELQPEFKNDSEMLNDAYYSLEDFFKKVKTKIQNLDYDENRLNEINERLSFLNTLKHKYHKSIGELINYKNELKQKIDSFEQIDDAINDAKNKVIKCFEELKQCGMKLTKERKASAKILETNVLQTLLDLMLPKVDLAMEFNKYDLLDPFNASIFKNDGLDDVDIKISFNVGEPKKSLSKVASGGEMSRIMLALKVHTLKTLKLSTVIFDEIDSGVSGSVAGKVGEKLKEISKDIQVLTITHLPIVASMADNQYHIYKVFGENSTSTKIELLDTENRVKMLAGMITPGNNNEKAIDLAKAMLKSNNPNIEI
ncbi:MAG: DNA repair protein RecN [Bacilli bacterium]|nr:DNA repair protein RecN [Bacilli bacterium]